MRQDDRIIDIFKNLYAHFLPNLYNKDEDLLVSFDGLSQHMAPEITNRGWLREKANGIPKHPWYHSDQSFNSCHVIHDKKFTKKENANKFESIQSWITFNDVYEGDATLSVIKGSHKKNIRDEFKNKYEITEPRGWYKLKNITQLEYFTKEKNLEIIDIKCPKGSLVLWDSRLIHCGKEPKQSRLIPNTRQVVYISYQPKSLCSEANLRKRKKAFDEMRMTGHSAAFPILFNKNPRTYGKELYKHNPLPKPDIKNSSLIY